MSWPRLQSSRSSRASSRNRVGRLLTAADEGARVTVLGSDLARTFGVGVGDSLDIRGVSFQIVGILEPTLTAPDTTARLPLAAAKELFLASLPPKLSAAMHANELATQIVVYPAPGTDPGPIASRIKALGNVTTMTSADWQQEVGSTNLMFNAIIVGVGLIRLALGALVVFVANEAGRSSGTSLFDLTAGTALFAVAFSTILGMIAGVIPAWNAARLDPVAALRYE